MADSWLQTTFAYTPWVLFALVVLVAYVMTRGEKAKHGSIGQTFACAGCGRRGAQEQMVTAHREGAVMWYCRACARRQSSCA